MDTTKQKEQHLEEFLDEALEKEYNRLLDESKKKKVLHGNYQKDKEV